MPRERIKLYRPKVGGTKTADKLLNRIALMPLVQKWWNDMVNSGVLYSVTIERKHKLDYLGQMPWPDAASFVSLYDDFIMSYGDKVSCTHAQFVHYLHKCTPLLAGDAKPVKIIMEDGKVLWRASRTFIELPRNGNV